jgi:hypothetical protein
VHPAHELRHRDVTLGDRGCDGRRDDLGLLERAVYRDALLVPAPERRPGAGRDADDDRDRREREGSTAAVRLAHRGALTATALISEGLGPLLGALAPALHRVQIEIVASTHVPIVSRIRKSARSYQAAQSCAGSTGPSLRC